MLLLCPSLFPLILDALPPVVSVDILNLSTSKFVTYVEFSNALSSSTLTRFHGYCLFISVVSMKRMMRIYAILDAVVNTHSIIVFVHMTVSMEVIPLMEVML